MFLKFTQWLVGFICLCPIVISLTLPFTNSKPNVTLSTTGLMSSITQCSGLSFREPSVADCLAAITPIQLTPNASAETTWSATTIFIPSVVKSCQIALIPLSSESEDAFSPALIGNTASDIALRCSSVVLSRILGRNTQGGRQMVGPKQMFYVSVGHA